ncbi:MAG: adenine deaminase C-terminal domain-containing protein [Armatimonadota bacterium]|nr:adenine deaminase C-terminal domain-containing protein [Armatimonadota bacterium]
MNRLSVPPLHAVTRRLAAVAAGREPPERVLRAPRLLSTSTQRTLPDREIWICAGRIAAVRPRGTFSGDGAAVVDCDGTLAPGLVDPHVHIESSMMTAGAYAEAALRNGTTTVFCDSHEIANVCDLQGVEWMLQDGRQAALSVYLTVPSTVPATSAALETAGGDLGPDKIGAVFDRWPEAVALGEKMDFVQVVQGDDRSHAILAEALRRGRPVCGHVYGREFVTPYTASGVTDTHEAIDAQIAEDLLEAGVWLFVRGGPPTTPWHSLPDAIRVVTEMGASAQRVCVCTDDRDADDLFGFGLDWVVRQAIAAGVRPEVAWSMGSLNPATRYGLDAEVGVLAPGRRADVVLLDDAFRVRKTWYGGVLAVDEGETTEALEAAVGARYRYPAEAYRTIRLDDDPHLVPAAPDRPRTANVMRPAPGILLHHERIELGPGPWSQLLARHDLCFVAVVERHGRGGGVAHGLLRGFGLRDGAVASSVGHDAHNLIVAGTSEDDMRTALQTVRRQGGGVCAVRQGKVLAAVPLPIAGLMSDKRAAEVARETTDLKRVWTELGCTLPYMGFNLISLSVIPQIRLTDRGLVLVPQMQIVPLFE